MVVQNFACLLEQFSGIVPELEASTQELIPDSDTSMPVSQQGCVCQLLVSLL